MEKADLCGPMAWFTKAPSRQACDTEKECGKKTKKAKAILTLEAMRMINKHGQGTYQWSSGNWYRGNFVNDMREGYGEMHWKDGTVYKGEWKAGIQCGYGKVQRPEEHGISSFIPIKNKIKISK